MRYLMMCEGTNEKTLINLLLDADKLIITRDDLIGEVPYATRQFKFNPTLKSELEDYNEKVYVLRIGDTQKDDLKIPSELKEIISKDRIKKYCTKPEFEILLIINEGLYNQYKNAKEKSLRNNPKQFAKKYVKYGKKKYDCTNEFIEDYYGGNRIDNLVSNIIEYKKIKKDHKDDEYYLADLLKK